MKVVPQIITLFIVTSVGWYFYERHDAFHALVVDVAVYAGLSQQPVMQAPSGISTTVTTGTPTPVEPTQMQTRQSAERATDLSLNQKTTLAEPQQALVAPPVLPQKQVSPATTAVAPESTSSPQSSTMPTELSAQQDASAPSEQPMLKSVDVLRSQAPQPVATDKVTDRKQQALNGLQAARAAWHQGDHDKAIQLYVQLMQEYNNHPDFAGELGNIYFTKGQTELAVKAYSEAFLRLIRNKDFTRAQQVLLIVYNIDQEQAAALKEYFAP